MAENKGKENKSSKKLTRRDFLKKAAIVGGAALAGGSLGYVAKKEVDVLEKGIETDSGLFIPLYEHHEVGITPEKIPPDLDVLFREYLPGRNLFKVDKQDIIFGFGMPYLDSHKEHRVFSEKILQKASINGTEIMIGDIKVNFKASASIVVLEGFAGILIAGKLLKDLITTPSRSLMTRRKFLKIATGFGMSWAMASISYESYRLPDKSFSWNRDRNDAFDRVIDRLYGLHSNLHPEESGHFFRNLVMADKMLTVAEDFKEKTGRKAKMGFQVEYAHNAIEDFLRVGHGFCRALILHYHKFFLKDVIERNNNIEDFASARLFKLPHDFTIQSPNWEKVEDRRVTDVELMKGLETKLA